MRISRAAEDAARPRAAARTFAADERGSLTIFGLFILAVMLMVGGMAVDLSRHEATRARLQGTLDRSVLAAASLNQPSDPETVVRDYFAISGLSRHLRSVEVTEGLNFRHVAATAIAGVDTLFLPMLGVDELLAPATGAAQENRLDVEIALVLDVSGSMSRNERLPRLKTAAQAFVEAVLRRERNRDSVSVSIVPFSTQVAAGADLLSYLTVSGEHDRSHCVDFDRDDFDHAGIEPGDVLRRTGHFDPFTRSAPPTAFVCPQEANREIVAFSNDIAVLKARIEDLSAGGNTSIDIGTKWGAFLLDPSSRPILTDRIAEGTADSDFAGRPLDYAEPQAMKVLIVMSDGRNTDQYQLARGYEQGPSGIWRDPESGRMSVWVAQSSAFYIPHREKWSQQPYDDDGKPSDGRGDPAEMSYPELWAAVSVDYHRAYHWGANPLWTIDGDEKDARTRAICTAAKTEGVVVFTIGFEAGDHGNAVLRDCASSPSHFFDVEGLEIAEAFSAISSTINRLRLSQ